MCFEELIGYTCGHCSPSVLRPCPLTTAYHTNPVCTNHASRPILASSMCPACQRVLHGRAVLIQEWEHRFMHERGACGCAVKFPELIHPRFAGPPAEATKTNNAIVGPNEHRGGKRGTTPPPLFQEIGPESDDRVQVAVRVPSLYAAEWVADHRRLHEGGVASTCHCPADFSHYKADWVDDGTTPQEADMINNMEQAFSSVAAEAQSQRLGFGRSPGAIHANANSNAKGPSTTYLFNAACAKG